MIKNEKRPFVGPIKQIVLPLHLQFLLPVRNFAGNFHALVLCLFIQAVSHKTGHAPTNRFVNRAFKRNVRLLIFPFLSHIYIMTHVVVHPSVRTYVNLHMFRFTAYSSHPIDPNLGRMILDVSSLNRFKLDFSISPRKRWGGAPLEIFKLFHSLQFLRDGAETW